MHLRLQSHLLQQRLRLRVGALRVGDESRLAHGRQTHAEVVCEDEFQDVVHRGDSIFRTAAASLEDSAALRSNR